MQSEELHRLLLVAAGTAVTARQVEVVQEPEPREKFVT
jgi:hypothetical protein